MDLSKDEAIEFSGISKASAPFPVIYTNEISPIMRNLAELANEIELNPVEALGHLYHPIPFIEFEHLTTSSRPEGVMKKWEMIEQTCAKLFSSLKGLKVLDIGANAGFYTFTFAQKGAKVTAYEPHPRYSKLGKLIADFASPNTRWYGRPYIYLENLSGVRFDLCLLLSTYQWMAAGGKEMDMAQKSLRQLSEISDYLMFELGYNRGSSHLKTTRFNQYSQLIDHLSKNTVYKHFQLIGKTRLWKSGHRYMVLCSNDPSLEDGFWRRKWRKIRI